MKLVDTPEAFGAAYLAFGFVDHFIFEDTAMWTTVATDSGTTAVGDAVGGVISLAPSDVTVADNDEVYLHSSSEVFIFANDKPIDFEVLINFTEANTDDANVFVGLADDVAADLIVDDGAGMKTSGSMVGFYKVDGGTNWNIIFSEGSNQQTAELTAVNSLTKTAVTSGGGVDQKLACQVRFLAGSRLEVIYKVDDKAVYKLTDLTYAGATEMAFCVGAKNGDTNNESIGVNYAACYQRIN